MDFGVSAGMYVKRLFALFFSVAALWSAAWGQNLVITNVRIYPDPASPAINAGDIVIVDGKITAIAPHGEAAFPKNAEVVDGRGLTAAAGFWNSHVHLLTPGLLHAETRAAAELSGHMQEMFTQWGFTTVFDLASVLDNTNVIRKRIEAGDVAGPQILSVGDPFFPLGGTSIYVKDFLEAEGFPSFEITDIPSARARVESQIERGADGVKLFIGAIVGGEAGVLLMPEEEAAALAQSAHEYDLPVFAHPTSLAGVNRSIETGVDILVHPAPWGGPWEPETVARLLDHDMALMPTLTLFNVEARKYGVPPEAAAKTLAAGQQQVAAYEAAGGQILFGTDIGYIDVYDTTEEYELMAGAGLDWRAILASLTTAPAKRFGRSSDLGRIAVGMSADIVLLDGDPADDVTAFARVNRTIRNGAILYSRPSAAEAQ